MKQSVRWFWKEWIKPLLVCALLVGSVRSAVADWNDVPTGSMKPTILEGDRVVVNKLAYDLKVPFTTWHVAEWANPQRGDIVVFFSPVDGMRLVKRVIGLPGDTIVLDNNRLLINGDRLDYEPLDASIVNRIDAAERGAHSFAAERLPERHHAVMSTPLTPAKRSFGPVIVPEGSYFVMGDSRDNSFDSRYFGAVSRKSIVGRATAVAFSLDYNRFHLPRTDRFFEKLQ